jgi:hypothetical protein
LSSRKKLLKEADQELHKIRKSLKSRILKRNIMGLVSPELRKKVEKSVKNMIYQDMSDLFLQLDNDLEKFRKQSTYMQRQYYREKQSKGVSIEKWWSQQSEWDRAIYNFESRYEKEYTGQLFEVVWVSMEWLIKNTVGALDIKKVGEEEYWFDPHTGNKISPRYKTVKVFDPRTRRYSEEKILLNVDGTPITGVPVSDRISFLSSLIRSLTI